MIIAAESLMTGNDIRELVWFSSRYANLVSMLETFYWSSNIIGL